MSEETILKIFFLSGPIIFAFLSVNVSNLSTHSRNFSSFLQPCLTGAGGAKDTDIKSTYIWVLSFRGVYAGSTWTNGACFRKAYIRDAFIKSTYIKGAGTENF